MPGDGRSEDLRVHRRGEQGWEGGGGPGTEAGGGALLGKGAK